MPRRGRGRPPEDVTIILRELEDALNHPDKEGRVIGNANKGVYAFYDYDGEPIYVGQTWEKLRVRIRRHLTNQRTDAVAMSVLDPFEVAEIEMWPLWQIDQLSPKLSQVKEMLASAEYTVFQSEQSVFSSFERFIQEAPTIDLLRNISSIFTAKAPRITNPTPIATGT